MSTLVIGYGNTLRGDDGVGPWVAQQVTAWGLDTVKSLSVHQLTPELGLAIAAAESVYFIDASHHLSEPHIKRLYPTVAATPLNHVWTPSTLLTLAQTLYSADPVAYHLLIPALQFDYGKTFSEIAQQGTDWAVNYLKTELTNRRVCHA